MFWNLNKEPFFIHSVFSFLCLLTFESCYENSFYVTVMLKIVYVKLMLSSEIVFFTIVNHVDEFNADIVCSHTIVYIKIHIVENVSETEWVLLLVGSVTKDSVRCAQ